MIDKENALLVLVDVQGNLALAMDDKEFLIENCRKMILGGKAFDIPIIITEQVKLGPTVQDLSRLIPDSQIIVKETFSCCGNEAFVQAIGGWGRRQILMTGIEAHVCVYQTSMDLLKMGYEIHLVADAVSSRTARNRDIGISKLLNSGAILTSTEMALFELLKTAGSPTFKDIFKIVK